MFSSSSSAKSRMGNLPAQLSSLRRPSFLPQLSASSQVYSSAASNYSSTVPTTIDRIASVQWHYSQRKGSSTGTGTGNNHRHGGSAADLESLQQKLLYSSPADLTREELYALDEPDPVEDRDGASNYDAIDLANKTPASDPDVQTVKEHAQRMYQLGDSAGKVSEGHSAMSASSNNTESKMVQMQLSAEEFEEWATRYGFIKTGGQPVLSEEVISVYGVTEPGYMKSRKKSKHSKQPLFALSTSQQEQVENPWREEDRQPTYRSALGHLAVNDYIDAYAELTALVNPSKEFPLGHAGAQSRLSLVLRKGWGTGKDVSAAFAFAQKSAERNHPFGLAMLGICYLSGIGTEKNVKLAVECFQRGADQPGDNAEALFQLGSTVYAGTGIATSKVRAYELITKAAEKGHEEAALRLSWNNRYQELFELPVNTPVEDRKRKEAMQQLVSEFTTFSRRVASTIVQEMDLDSSLKTIMPHNKGGSAGGEKFVYGNVLFKFARDWKGIYGGDEFAQKAACLEITHMNAVIDASIPQLHTTLSAVFYVRGHRVYATALAPLSGKTSLVYGSDDAGLTVRNSSRAMNVMALRLADELHLKPHLVFDRQNRSFTLHTAIDVEGHMSLEDGRYYVCDLARLCPPVPPRSAHRRHRSDFLCRLFRPEFMRQHVGGKDTISLSADAFSNFGERDPQSNVHKAEVQAAHSKLFTLVIPLLASHLDSEAKRQDSLLLAISHSFHQFGVNMRYLGDVWRLCSEPRIKSILAEEMIVRSIKERVYHWLRHSTSDDEGLLLVIRLLGYIFGAYGEEKSEECWRKMVFHEFKSKYGLTLFGDMKEYLDRIQIFSMKLLESFPSELLFRIAKSAASSSSPSTQLDAALLQELSSLSPPSLSFVTRLVSALYLRFEDLEEFSDKITLEEPSPLHGFRVIGCVLLGLREEQQKLTENTSNPANLSPSSSSQSLMDVLASLRISIKVKSVKVPPFLALDQAEHRYLESLTLREQALETTVHPQLMSTLLGLLNLYKMYASQVVPKSSSASPSTPRDTGTSSSPPSSGLSLSRSPSSSLSMAELENIHRKAFTEGEKIIQRILVIHQQFYIYNALDEVAKFYQHFGRYEQCRRYREQDLREKEEKEGKESTPVATVLDCLGVVCSFLGDFSTKRSVLERSLAIKEKVYDRDHEKVSWTLTYLGDAYRQLGLFDLSQRALERALQIRERVFGPVHPDTAHTLYSLASLYAEKQDHLKRKELLQRVLAIQEEDYGPHHPLVAMTLQSLGLALGSLGDAAKMKEYLERSYHILQGAYGMQHPDTLSTLAKLGRAYYLLGQQEVALHSMDRVVGVAEVLFGANHSTTVEFRRLRTEFTSTAPPVSPPLLLPLPPLPTGGEAKGPLKVEDATQLPSYIPEATKDSAAQPAKANAPPPQSFSMGEAKGQDTVLKAEKPKKSFFCC